MTPKRASEALGSPRRAPRDDRGAPEGLFRDTLKNTLRVLENGALGSTRIGLGVSLVSTIHRRLGMAIGGAVYYGDSRSRSFVHRSRAVDGGSSSVDSSARCHERAPEIEAERQKNDAARDSGAELSSRELHEAHERQTRWPSRDRCVGAWPSRDRCVGASSIAT